MTKDEQVRKLSVRQRRMAAKYRAAHNMAVEARRLVTDCDGSWAQRNGDVRMAVMALAIRLEREAARISNRYPWVIDWGLEDNHDQG